MGLAPPPRLCFCNDVLGLISVFGGDLTVGRNDLGRRQDLLSISCVVRCNLGGFRPRESATRDCLHDLLATRTGGVKVFLRVAFDLWRSAPPGSIS